MKLPVNLRNSLKEEKWMILTWLDFLQGVYLNWRCYRAKLHNSLFNRSSTYTSETQGLFSSRPVPEKKLRLPTAFSDVGAIASGMLIVVGRPTRWSSVRSKLRFRYLHPVGFAVCAKGSSIKVATDTWPKSFVIKYFIVTFAKQIV